MHLLEPTTVGSLWLENDLHENELEFESYMGRSEKNVRVTSDGIHAVIPYPVASERRWLVRPPPWIHRVPDVSRKGFDQWQSLKHDAVVSRFPPVTFLGSHGIPSLQPRFCLSSLNKTSFWMFCKYVTPRAPRINKNRRNKWHGDSEPMMEANFDLFFDFDSDEGKKICNWHSNCVSDWKSVLIVN